LMCLIYSLYIIKHNIYSNISNAFELFQKFKLLTIKYIFFDDINKVLNYLNYNLFLSYKK